MATLSFKARLSRFHFIFWIPLALPKKKLFGIQATQYTHRTNTKEKLPITCKEGSRKKMLSADQDMKLSILTPVV